MKLYIHDEWAVIERSTIPPQVGYDQRRDLKLFFYMGAEAMYRVIANAEHHDQDENFRQHLVDELSQFTQELMSMRSQGDA